MVRYLDRSSWRNAEHECKNRGMHLWSINSHSEWWNIYPNVGTAVISKKFQQDVNTEFKKIPSTVILFIGLHISNKVNI